MAGMTGHDIYVAMTSGPGTGSLEDAYQIADNEAKREAERAELIKRIADRTQAGWEGEAGEASYGGAKPIADATVLGVENLERTHGLLRMQVDTFGDLSSKLEPMEANPPETGAWDELTPWDTDTEDQLNEYNEKSQKNIDVYRAYDSTSQMNGQELPTDYSDLVDPNDEFSVNLPPDVVGPEGGNPPPGSVNPPHVKGPDPTTAQSWTQPTQQQGILQVDPPPVGPGGNQNGNENIGVRPQQYIPTPPGPGQQQGLPQYPGQQTTGNRPGADTWGGFGGQGGAGAGGYGSGSRGGAGAGGFGARGGPGAGGAGAGGAGAGEHGPNARAGAGAAAGEHGPGSRGFGGAAAEEGRAGGRGQAGTGAGGGRGGQGAEDEEHERASFLIEDDPEAMFGTDEMTAPPVIGA